MTDEKLKVKQTAFLVETVAFYSQDPVRLRSKNCSFLPNGDSPGCAIGRKIPDKETAAILENAATFQSLELLLPEELRVLGLRFIRTIMFFHDENDYWNSTGLSVEGRRRVNQIQKEINDGQFKNRWYD